MINTTGIPVSEIHVETAEADLKTSLTEVFHEEGIIIYDFEISGREASLPQPMALTWKIPSLNVKGVWKPTSDFAKRIQADWELEHMESRISIDAPVICLFGHDDSNVLTFACSEAIHKLEMNARLREEDNHFYCHITFFSEPEQTHSGFRAQLRLDYRTVHFSDSLKKVAKWWESFENMVPAHVPAIARKPLYSTWYQFHQNLDLEVLRKECKMAYRLGYAAVIIDDGWQTTDSNRGYDYTGDWQPERIPDMAGYVGQLHQLGIKVALWYSVPFCGKKSKAYQRFKGKFLTEGHRWAPVFDPRYPEVRAYLISLYTHALKDWKLDGFKLDFIDDFRLYKDTPLGLENGRDYASINEAVDRLMTDVIEALRAINPEVFIEFRQKYIGPAMRKYGNMLRAFDCPGDATMNRVRIADIRLLCAKTAVHSDMITWHSDEPVEIAALQLVNTLFGVPQLSVMLQETKPDHLQMIAFYTKYWNAHAEVLLEGDFVPFKPLGNYPLQKVSKENHTIIGIHDTFVVPIDREAANIHLINAHIADEIVLNCTADFGIYTATIYDCMGNCLAEKSIDLSKGPVLVQVPPCGMAMLAK